MRANTTQNPLIQLIEHCYKEFNNLFPTCNQELRLKIPNQTTITAAIDRSILKIIDTSLFLSDHRETFHKLVKKNAAVINNAIMEDRLKEAAQLHAEEAYEKYELNTDQHIYRVKICLLMLMKITTTSQAENKKYLTAAEKGQIIGNTLLYLNRAYNACPDIYKTVDYKNTGFFESTLQPFFNLIRTWPCCTTDDATAPNQIQNENTPLRLQ